MEFTMAEYTMIRLALSERARSLDSLPAAIAPNSKKAADRYRELLKKIEENQP